MRDLYIIGAGGHGVVVAEIAALLGFPIAGFIDDNPARAGQRVLDWPILGGRDSIPAGAAVALGIGHNGVRAQFLQEAAQRGWALPVLVHPSAVISPSATLCPGTVVVAQVVVNARTTVGAGCILNTACSVDHDCLLDEAVHIAPGTRLAGNVTVGTGTLIGVGSCARPGLTIGAHAVIGAGSVLVSDIPDGATAFGNPARVRG